MRLRNLVYVLMVGLVLPAVAARADEKPASPASAQFDALKKLAGDWVAVGKDGKPTDTLAASIKVTAAGSVVEETLFPGTPHEMVTMYHLDGPGLVLTHYCVLGNQPTMRAEPSTDASRIVFSFVGASNLKSETDNHMDHATLTILGPDHYRSHWTSCQEGKPCHDVELDFVRKGK